MDSSSRKQHRQQDDAESMDAGGVVGANMGVSAAMAVAAHVHAQAQAQAAASGASSFMSSVGGGDIDSLLSSDAASANATAAASIDAGGSGEDKVRRLSEPYERHRAHDLRAECYRRGMRPIKKGPNANDNKNGYILLLRKLDGTAGANGSMMSMHDFDKRHDDDEDEDDGNGNGNGNSSSEEQLPSLAKKRKLPSTQQEQQQMGSSSSANSTSMSVAAGGLAAAGPPSVMTDLSAFYDNGQPTLVPVLPMQQYTAIASKQQQQQQQPGATASSAPTTTDLEILSGIANTYTQNTGTGGGSADGQLCGSCRTVVTDQLMESIRLGKSRMQLQEYHKLTDQRDRDTMHLKEVLHVLAELRKAYRAAQSDGSNHELLVELGDDIAFFLALKERTKECMRLAMQDRAAAAAASKVSSAITTNAGAGSSS